VKSVTYPTAPGCRAVSVSATAVLLSAALLKIKKLHGKVFKEKFKKKLA